MLIIKSMHLINLHFWTYLDGLGHAMQAKRLTALNIFLCSAYNWASLLFNQEILSLYTVLLSSHAKLFLQCIIYTGHFHIFL